LSLAIAVSLEQGACDNAGLVPGVLTEGVTAPESVGSGGLVQVGQGASVLKLGVTNALLGVCAAAGDIVTWKRIVRDNKLVKRRQYFFI